MSDPVLDDFSDVVRYLRRRHLFPANAPAEIRALARRLHRAVYSIVAWRMYVRVASHGKGFLDEAGSDAILVIPHALAGFPKTPFLLIRGIIENVLRHIYFTDHRVEYERMNRDLKWYMSADQLFDYLKNHYIFINTESQFNAIGRLRDIYSQLSANVHGAKEQDLALVRALDQLELKVEDFREVVRSIEAAVGCCNFLLLLFHSQRRQNIPPTVRQLHFQTMPPTARRVARGLR